MAPGRRIGARAHERCTSDEAGRANSWIPSESQETIRLERQRLRARARGPINALSVGGSEGQ
jgi:hypothetical protein